MKLSISTKVNKIDIFMVLLFPAISSAISFFFHINAFISILLFFGLPAAYISVRNFSYTHKALIFSFCTSVPAIIAIDYISEVTGQWLIPHSIITHRLFGFVTLEVIVWAFLNFYTVVVFYEFFLNHHHSLHTWNHRGKHILLFVLGCSILFLTLLLTYPSSLLIPYYYLCFGITLILLPVIKELTGHPNLIFKFFITATYFFYLSFLYEITALHLDWWRFPSTQYIGTVNIFNVTFPFEELVFWLMLLSMAVLTIYERYTGNEKQA